MTALRWYTPVIYQGKRARVIVDDGGPIVLIQTEEIVDRQCDGYDAELGGRMFRPIYRRVRVPREQVQQVQS